MLKQGKALTLKGNLRRLLSSLLLAGCAACATAVFTPSAMAGAVTTYRGICNASAGIDLGSGFFIVADDDINTLVIYQYEKPAYVDKVDLGDYLRSDDGKTKEADLEGAARIGDRIYWIASHGRNGDGEVRPTRHRLFATRIVASGANPTVRPLDAKPYSGLLEALAPNQRFEELTSASKIAPEASGGLNIEGLADTQDRGLLIGFRNPLSKGNGEALVLKLKNPAAVVEQGASPVFDDLIRLDLGHRGIRSMERIGAEYFIVAGPYDNGTLGAPSSRFAIYKWSGTPGVAPEHWKDIAPPDFHAEGLFEIAGAKQLYLLSDDGDLQASCKKGKKKDKPSEDKTFRGMRLDF
jgi:hypothetical protein